jgi:cell surface protein SprA
VTIKSLGRIYFWLRRPYKLLLSVGVAGCCFALLAHKPVDNVDVPSRFLLDNTIMSGDSTPTDSSSKDSLKYPIKDKKIRDKNNYHNSLSLKDPANIRTEVKYNPTTGKYEYKRIIGDSTVLESKELTFDEYLKERARNDERNYFKQKSRTNTLLGNNGGIPQFNIKPKIFTDLLDGGLIDIQPSGSAELSFGGNFNTVKNPQLNARQQKTGQFDFDQKLQLNVRGKIGNRLQLGIKYDTEATFDFENETNLDWVGDNDDIIKKIELGNVSLPLSGSLIQAGQSLFGIKTELQFGRLRMTTIFTQDKGESNEVEVSGGAQVTKFNIQANNYDANRHYFLTQFFKDNYDQALSNLPAIISGVEIKKIEVWVTNKSGRVDQPRDIVALMDLAEPGPHNPAINASGEAVASNGANDLFDKLKTNPNYRVSATFMTEIANQYTSQLRPGVDFDLVNYARLLSPTEYEINTRLGYISLNTALNNDEVLGVAFEYFYNGTLYKVGEFSQDVALDPREANVLFLKMLKPSTIRTDMPTWDLMMKNIYSLGTYNLNTSDLRFNIIYADDKSNADLNYLPVDGYPGLDNKKPLLSVMNMDRVNRLQELKPDGILDVIEGVTVNSRRGRIIFPVREPFGDFLKDKFNGASEADKYEYRSLYDSTKFWAEQDVSHNKFFLRGSYKGNSSSRISLGAFNIPQGSVRVTLNGSPLTENVDYIVDYNIGEVTIINEAILQSGGVINASFENNSLFNVQQKTLVGARFDYTVSPDFLLGGTVMHMYERPLTPKTNIGEEPILNTIFGVDGSYTKRSRFLTKMVDKIPLIETKEESKITIEGEFAKIIAHRPKSLGNSRGVSYIDDFEAAETPFDLRSYTNWYLASTPQGQPDLFPEASQTTDRVRWMDKRANIAWYTMDPLYYQNNRFTPTHIKEDPKLQSNHYVRDVMITEVFRNKNIPQGTGTSNVLGTFDISYFPKHRGQYNYNSSVQDLNADGTFSNPDENWGGIMRRIETNDFEAANIDYIEIWFMDPFIYDTSGNNSGDLYINLGNVSEDIIPDGRKSFENGIPEDGDTSKLVDTDFGMAPLLPAITNSFATDDALRNRQDVGLDLLNDAEERSFWDTAFLDKLEANFTTNSKIYQDALADPSNDNFIYHRDPQYDGQKRGIRGRYSRFNMMQGNANTNQLSDGTPASASVIPDIEDINRDNTTNQTEDYYQYKVSLHPDDLRVGYNYVTDKIITKNPAVQLKDGSSAEIAWYQLKIPIRDYQKRVGSIPDFKSIRFMRMFMKGFSDSVTLRFAMMQLVRADWRRYQLKLNDYGPQIPIDPLDDTKFTIATVNIEENGGRKPIPYKEPPGIQREFDQTNPNASIQQNEQSLSLAICELKPGDSRAVYKTSNLDIRNYKNIRMFVHAEGEDIQDDEAYAFIRVGTDLISNYYEYEIPLKITAPNATAKGDIWPAENNLDFALEELYTVKLERDELGYSLLKPYIKSGGTNTIRLIGNPDLSNVRVMMIGVRNKTDRNLCGEYWFNELRLQDFNNKGGWAANARVLTKLADFSTVNLSGSITTIGFGGVDKTLNERSLEDVYKFDISTNTQLGKFFPKRMGVSVPMFIGYNEIHINPKYYPLNPDIELKTKLNSAKSSEEKKKIKDAARDFTSRYSINFTNIHKTRASGAKQHFWDIENFNFTYAYQREYRHNQEVEEFDAKTYHGSVGYNFSPKFKGFQPFKKLIKGRKWSLIKDINFNPIPSNVNIRSDVDRYYSELQYRSNDQFAFESPRLFDKFFTMTRVYSAHWNLTKSLKLDYNANTNARIEEPIGRLDSEQKRDSVRDNFFNFGKMSKFNQTANATYNLPFRKIKSLNWISASTRYSANYSWDQAPPAADYLGNTIQNSRVISVNGQLNFISFYNKFPALRKALNQRKTSSRKQPRSSDPDAENAEDGENKKKKKKDNKGGNAFIKGLLMLKNATFTYSNTEGTALPGFRHNVDHFGQNFKRELPGWNFIFGSQNPEVRYKLAEQGALSNDPRLNNFFIQTQTERITGKLTVEPIKGFRINLDFDKQVGTALQSIFRYDTTAGFERFRDLGLTYTGTYSLTYIFWKTAFDKDLANGKSPVFKQFEDNRYIVAQRLQNEDPRVANNTLDTTTQFPLGYDRSSQDVLIPAFLAAYTGRNNSSIGLTTFPKIPLPAWRVNYNGLSNIESIKHIFSNISIKHGYQGRYSVGGYNSNPTFDPNEAPAEGESFQSENRITSVSIIESMTPLLGIDMTFVNGWNVNLEYKQSRNINFFVASFSVTETKSSEFVIGAGYRSNDVKLPIRFNGKRVYLDNDFNFHLDFSVRNDKTLVRKVDQPIQEPTSGNRIILINPTVDYMVNDKINLNIFYMRTMSKPATTLYFPTALTEFGFKLRYTIQ